VANSDGQALGDGIGNRLVFGQARQDDLVEYLSGVDNPAVLEDLRIDLTPPSRLR